MKWAIIPIELRGPIREALGNYEGFTAAFELKYIVGSGEEVVVGDRSVFGACIAGRAATHFAFPADRLEQLERYVLQHAEQIKAAEIVVTPFVHLLTDANGSEFAVVAWGKTDAVRRIEQHGPPRVTLPVEWTGAWDCWPSDTVTWLRDRESEN